MRARIPLMKRATKPSEPSAWRTAAAWGVDMDLLALNLRRTPAERMRHHNQALATIIALQKAGAKHHARSR